MIRPNKLRQLLKENKPSLCVRVNSLWPDIVEVVGSLGLYDYVEFAAEYAAFDMQGMDNFCRTAELYGLGTMIKIDQDPRMSLAQRAIGSGFQSILFVDCRTKEEVEACISFCKPDTPEDRGLYGAASRRFAYGCRGHGEFAQTLRDIVVAVMVEKKALIDDLEAVLSVPGIDMVQWGPSDFTMSSGLQRSDPVVKETERYVVETALRKGVAPRIELHSLEGLDYYLELGVRHFSIGNDLTILRQFWTEKGTVLKDRLAQK